jgi:hypothetical protein
MTNEIDAERYAAKLLFQFRIGEGPKATDMRLVEERIVVFHCMSADAAHREAMAYGRSERHRYRNDVGAWVRFEFVGVVELLHLGPATSAKEVWYELRSMRAPMERRGKLIPSKRKLNAIAAETPPGLPQRGRRKTRDQ